MKITYKCLFIIYSSFGVSPVRRGGAEIRPHNLVFVL